MSFSKQFSLSLIKDDLSDYGFYLKHSERQRERIAEIESEMYSLKAVTYSSVPTSGGTSRQEDRMVDLIARKQKLEEDVNHGRRLEKEFRDSLSVLSEPERDIVMTLWVYRDRDGIRRLTEKYVYSRASIYRISDQALSRLARIRYGVKD